MWASKVASASEALAQVCGVPPVSLITLYDSLLAVMINQLRYRFYQLSYVDVLRGSPDLREMEASLAEARRKRTRIFMRRLVEQGYLEDALLTPRMEGLHEVWTLTMTSWLRAVEIEAPRRSDREALLHYAKLVMTLFEPYCSPEGQAEMALILSGKLDAGRAA